MQFNHRGHKGSQSFTMMNKKDEYPEQELTREIISAAMEVHTHWGPGLNEKIYELSFCRELILRRIPFTRQLGLPLEYKAGASRTIWHWTFFVDGRVIVENKHVADVLPIHKAQLMTYMKITGCRVGLLINYKEVRLKKRHPSHCSVNDLLCVPLRPLW